MPIRSTPPSHVQSPSAPVCPNPNVISQHPSLQSHRSPSGVPVAGNNGACGTLLVTEHYKLSQGQRAPQHGLEQYVDNVWTIC
jgi:hypothetical protein